MKFIEYVARQMEPFGGMNAPNGQLYATMRKPLADCLIGLSGESEATQMVSAQSWSATRPGERVAAVCRECATFEECPTITIVRAVWERLFPKADGSARKCRQCNGDNFVSRDGPHGLTYAIPCDHGGQFNDPGMTLGARQSAKYHQEGEDAKAREIMWRNSESFRKGCTPEGVREGRGMRRAQTPRAVLDVIG